MNLMFWKKKETTEDGDDTQHMPDDGIESQEPAEPDTHDGEISEDTDAEAETGSATGSKGLLVMGTLAGILILAASGFFAWKFFLSSHKQSRAPADNRAATRPAPPAGNQLIQLPRIGFRQAAKVQPDSRTTDIEASGEKTGESPADANRIAASGTAPTAVASHPSDIDAPAQQDGGLQTQALSSTPNGDLIVGSKSSKSAAMALKKMIDAMNAGSDASPENAAK